jgi:phosphoglycolate phosphatase
MKIHTVIFDLDGTLIDSAPSILSSIRSSFDQIGFKPIKELTQGLIGPPLKDIFLDLLDESKKEQCKQLIEGFKHYYDISGYKDTRVYEGVVEMLNELLKEGLDLYIATNKRLAPTLKIIEYLEWERKFKGVYALDYFRPILHNKMEMLNCLHKSLPLTTNGAVYIGDRLEDADAAEEAGISFMLAGWGYEPDNTIPRDFPRISRPSELLKYLRGL